MKFKIILFTITLVSFNIIGQNIEKKRLYLGNDTHVDIMYNGTDEQWSKKIIDMAEFYLKLGEDTKDLEPRLRSKWNYDVSFWLYTLEKNTSKEYFQRIINQIKNQQASVPYNFTLPVYGASTGESILRSFYYSGYLQRKYGIDVELAICQENATIPLGLSSLWAGSGAKYSWKGVCNCATKTNTIGRRRNEMYWYKGLDDSKILMKWYSNWGWNAEIGGYAELLEPTHATMQLDTLCDTKAYPFKIAAAFGKGWDNMHNYCYDLQWGMNHRTRPGTEVYISNELDFFKDFESNYGNILNSETYAFGNEWDLGVASLAEPSAGVKRAMEKLRSAEALAAIVAKNNPKILDQFAEPKQDFMYAISMYNAHGWTIDGPVSREDFAKWAKLQQKNIQKYVDELYEFSATELGKKINAEGKQNRIYVFNQLNWSRNELVTLPINYKNVSSVKDLETGEILAVQKSNGEFKFIAKAIPSVGYKVFEVLESKAKAISSPFVIKNNKIQTPYYTLQLSNGGEITSLIDKKTKKEWVKETDSLFINDLGKGLNTAGSLEILENGPFALKILAKGSIPLKYETTITLFANDPKVNFENKILQNFGDAFYWTFSVNESKPTVWHEEIGAVIKAKTENNGGHYSARNARYDHLSLNHFASVNGENSSLILSNRDCLFMKLGKSTTEKLDENSAQINVLAGGQIDKDKKLGIYNQDGDSYFVQHFSILPQTQMIENVAAMKFALAHQNPLVVKNANGNELNPKSYSYLNTNDINTVMWVLKPGEEEGTVARFWNLENNPKKLIINTLDNIEKVNEVTHVETFINKTESAQNKFVIDLNRNQMKTIQFFLK